jgi:hypothetical protein
VVSSLEHRASELDRDRRTVDAKSAAVAEAREALERSVREILG